MVVKFCTSIFKALLILFPPDFRHRFDDEMVDLFTQVASEARRYSVSGCLKVCLHEFFGSASEAFRQRFENFQILRRKSAVQRCRWEGPPSRRETALMLAVFLAPACAILAKFLPPSLFALTGPLVVAFVCGVFFTGLIKGLPRWSLPYLGLTLSGISLMYLFNQAADLSAPYFLANIQIGALEGSDRILFQAFWAGLLWLGFFIAAFLVLGIMVIWHRFQPSFRRLRQDWTQVSFILYNGSYLALYLFFGHSTHKGALVLASLFSLVMGSYIYLRSPLGWQRISALLAGVSLAIFIGAAGELQSIPFQADIGLFLLGGVGQETLRETGRLAVIWCWLMILLLLPGILSFLPPPDEPSVT